MSAAFSGIPLEVDCRGISVVVAYSGEDIVNSGHVEDTASAIGLLYNAEVRPCSRCWKCCQAFSVRCDQDDSVLERRLSRCIPLLDGEREIIRQLGWGDVVNDYGVIPVTTQGVCSAFKDGECILQPFMPIACRSYICSERIVKSGDRPTPHTLYHVQHALQHSIKECITLTKDG